MLQAFILIAAIPGSLLGAGPPAADSLFEENVIPLSGPDARPFLGYASDKQQPDLFVLEGRRLTVYPRSSALGSYEIRLAEDATAFEVVDINGDKRAEVLSLCGRRFMVQDLPPGDGHSPTELFACDTTLTRSRTGPYPCPLTLTWEGKKAVACPSDEGLAIWGLDGTRLALLEPGEAEDKGIRVSETFSAFSTPDPHARPEGVLEGSVRYEREIVLTDTNSSPLEARPGRLGRRGTPRQVRETAGDEARQWPWFPLRATQPEWRVLYAHDRHTLIRLWDLRSEMPGAEWPRNDAVGGPKEPGPVRRYPGYTVLPADDLPDFNGDGYTDLLLWTSPEPGLSVDSMARTMLTRAWPIRLNVHLFSPKKGRFEPRPASSIQAQLPVGWFLLPADGAPLRNVVLRDFNGDGKTDCAFSTDEHGFSAWLYGDGFQKSPDAVHTFRDSILGVAFKADLTGDSAASVALRGERGLYVLRAAAAP